MQKSKLIIFFVFFFFFGVISVSAAYEGFSDTTHYVETDKKTNYIKIELFDGNVMLYQLDSTNSALSRQFKEYVFQEHFDGVSVSLTPGYYHVNQGNFEETSCNFKNFSTPVLGDLVAVLDGEACAVSGFEIFLAERGNSKAPVIGHMIAGSSVLTTSFTSIKSIRFVTIEKDSQENNNSDNTPTDETENNDSNGTSRPAVTDYCSRDLELLKTFKFIGRILSIVKILIPLVIIILGVIDFFKAVTTSKDDEIKKSSKSLVMRVIAGVIIFFLPTLVNLVFMLIDDWGNYRTDYSVCSTCVLNPSKCKV